jgi:hypothetical protein
MVFGKAAFVAPPPPGVAPRAPRPFPSPSSRPPVGRCPAAPVPPPSARGGPDVSCRLVAAVRRDGGRPAPAAARVQGRGDGPGAAPALVPGRVDRAGADGVSDDAREVSGSGPAAPRTPARSARRTGHAFHPSSSESMKRKGVHAMGQEVQFGIRCSPFTPTLSPSDYFWLRSLITGPSSTTIT